MQQVAARNCCTEQRVARAPASRCRRSWFGTRPRDPMRLQRVLLWQRAFCMDFARFRRARATDWVASCVIHGRTLLCTAVNYADPILRECYLLLAALRRESTLKTNVKSEGAVTAAVCFRTGLLRPRVRWSRCAHQGRSVGLPRRRRRERNGEQPTHIAAAATASRRK